MNVLVGMEKEKGYIDMERISYIVKRGKFYFITINDKKLVVYRTEELDNLIKKMVAISPTTFVWEDGDFIIENDKILNLDDVVLTRATIEKISKGKVRIKDLYGYEYICFANRILFSYKHDDHIIMQVETYQNRALKLTLPLDFIFETL